MSADLASLVNAVFALFILSKEVSQPHGSNPCQWSETGPVCRAAGGSKTQLAASAGTSSARGPCGTGKRAARCA